MAEITIQSAFCAARRLALGPRITIGRATDSDLFLPDQRLSRHHAEIQDRTDGYWVVDLGSTNGTFLNGERVDGARALQDGDVVTVGETALTFRQQRQDRQDRQDRNARRTSERQAREALLKPAKPFGAVGRAAADRPGGATDWLNAGTGVQPLPEPASDRTASPDDRTVATAALFPRATRRTIQLSDLGIGGAADPHRLLAVLGRASSELVQLLPVPELYGRLVDVLLDALPAERAAVLMAGSAGGPRIVASRDRQGSTPIAHVSAELARRVMEGQVTLLLQDVDAEPSLRTRDSIIATGIRSVLCAPLWLRDATVGPARVIGMVYLDCRGRAGVFGDDDLQILTVLANMAAAKIENARLVADRLERERLEEELRLAAEIQATIMPAVAPVVPGYDVIGATRSSGAVGGDYYDFLLDGSMLYAALGDVSGKGVAAAMLMTALRAAVRAHWRGPDLPSVLEQVNHTFRQCVPHDRYATFFLARVDVARGCVDYVNAGHNQPLLVRATGAVEVLADGGTIVGAFDHPKFALGQVQLLPGDTLLMFSDGVSDAFASAEDADARMVQLIRSLSERPARDVQRAIFDEVERRMEGRVSDDRTVIVLKRPPAP